MGGRSFAFHIVYRVLEYHFAMVFFLSGIVLASAYWRGVSDYHVVRDVLSLTFRLVYAYIMPLLSSVLAFTLVERVFCVPSSFTREPKGTSFATRTLPKHIILRQFRRVYGK